MFDRKTFVEININNYLHNLQLIKDRNKSNIIPVLKADGYGHGAIQLSKAAYDFGVDLIAVAFLGEGIEIKKNGVNIETLVFNYVTPKYIKENIENFIYTIGSLDQLEELINYFGKDIKNIKLHININTGMNRMGLNIKDLDKMIKIIKDYNLNIHGIYSHFATADNLDDFVKEQYELYINAVNYIENANINIPIKHISNSAASLFFPEYSLDYVRPGIATYGLQPSDIKIEKNLKPVLTWKSIVARIGILKKNESVSYGRTFFADKDIPIATIPVGYADGYFRQLSNKGYVLIQGEICNIIGRVCMDQFVVETTKIPEIKLGEEVVLIGKQKEKQLYAENLAKLAGTINYDITSKITKRVPRVYIEEA
ncbi:alanine racemase [Marinitoga hydrogenitolerans DSM 16785]|uniref:Alanine racemase n=1 Tax=Marinitoga hydrogenitolerans (strain DSM 16785 / JCM 12826 / AT1271) TaxID=1122195 RepID=A0A1M4S8Z9_MARH1|nr:alanine racemase [Marinitoga hydrogenitolerans]SHE28662.1 alanine racemase [Marinitoga hydrogenitolerans DSM 16785]